MIDRTEALRYLGAKTDEGIADVLDAAIVRAEKLSPKHVTAEYEITDVASDGVTLGNGLKLSGQLAKNSLQGCNGVILLAATLTLEADKMIATAGGTLKEAVTNAVLSAAIEAYLDAVEAALVKKYAAENKYLTKRFSPGYSDLPLALQRDLLKLTDAEKLLGIHLTESLMLIPVKSVTAIIGVASNPIDRTAHKCDRCNKPCIYKKL